MALAYLRQARSLIRHRKESRARSIVRLRHWWVEATIMERLGSHRKALRLYEQAYIGFRDFSLPWDMALVGIDYTALLLITGDDKAHKVAVAVFQQFRELCPDTRAIQAVSSWTDAVVVLKKWEKERFDVARQLVHAQVVGHCCRRKKAANPPEG